MLQLVSAIAGNFAGDLLSIIVDIEVEELFSQLEWVEEYQSINDLPVIEDVRMI